MAPQEGNEENMDIQEMLDQLAEYQAQVDLLDLKERELLDEVKIPAEVLQAQDEANKRRQAVDSALWKEEGEIKAQTEAALAEITEPELPPDYAAAMRAYRAEVERINKQAANQLEQALDSVEKWNNETMQIDMVFVDYLQRIPFEGKVESKTIGTSENLDRLKDAALAFGTRVVAGAQASREVDSRDLPIPQMNDGQWTSNVEQASDGIITLVRPRKYRNEGEKFGSQIVKGHCQMLISVIKRKLGPDNFAKWVYFQPEYNKLDELEMKHLEERR